MDINTRTDESRPSSRRRFLITAGSAAAVGLAGCSGDDSTDEPSDDGNSSDEPSGDTEDSGTDDTQSEPAEETPSNPVRLSTDASEQLLLAAVEEGSETTSFGEEDVTVEHARYSRAVGMGGE